MKDNKLYLASAGVLTALAIFGTGFIVTCLIAGFLVFFCFWLLVQKSHVVRFLVRRFPLITDAAVTLGSFFMFSGMGIVAILASSVVGILTTGYVAKERMRWLESKEQSKENGQGPRRGAKPPVHHSHQKYSLPGRA